MLIYARRLATIEAHKKAGIYADLCAAPRINCHAVAIALAADGLIWYNLASCFRRRSRKSDKEINRVRVYPVNVPRSE